MANKTIDNYSALSAPASDDYLLAWDASASATKKVPLSALGVDLPSLMAGYSTLPTAATDDTLFIYDTSTGAMKKIAAGNLAYNLAAEVAAATALSTPANDDTIPVYDFSAGDIKAIPYSTFAGALKADGSVSLTADWDAGAGRVIKSQYLRARSAAGVRIESDGADLGVYVHDDGKVGIGTTAVTTAPTASLTTLTNVKAGYNTDATSFFGRAAIGSYAAVSDTATFAHLDHNESNPALKQTAGGATEIDAASGQYVRISVGNSPILVCNSSNQVYNAVANSALGTSVYPWTNIWASTLNAATISAAADLTLQANGSSRIVYSHTNNSLEPTTTGGQSLGRSAARWANIYANALYAASLDSTGNITFSVNGSNRVIYNHTNNSLEPSTDAGQSLGRSGMRWSAVWASNGTIQTSDEREKQDIALSDLGLGFVRALRPIRYRWRDSQDERDHYGLSAQQAVQALAACGARNFGGHDWDAQSDRHGLNYAEFTAPMIRAIQELADRLDMMEAHYGQDD